MREGLCLFKIQIKRWNGRCWKCSFSQTFAESAKRAHIRYVHPEKVGKAEEQHQCELCGKSFNKKANLKSHMAYSHSNNEGPNPKYQCHICSKYLKQSNSYGKHMRNVHGVGERCDICNKLYCLKNSLGIHKRDCHGIDFEELRDTTTTTSSNGTKISELVDMMFSVAEC